MTFIKELRTAAMGCSNVEYRALLRHHADALVLRLELLHTSPTSNNMRALNAAWSQAVRVLKNIPPEAPPAPLSGSTEPARLAA